MPAKPDERIIATILNTDVIGNTRQLTDDEVATLRDLKAHSMANGGTGGQYGGRVVDMVCDNQPAGILTQPRRGLTGRSV